MKNNSKRKGAVSNFKKSFQNMDPFKWILFSIIVIYILSLLCVMYFGLINSLKSVFEFTEMQNYLGFPKDPLNGWMFENYVTAFNGLSIPVVRNGVTSDVYLFEMLINSLLYSVMMAFFTIAFQVAVAYACAKYKFKGRRLLYNVAIIVMIIPIVGSLASEMQFAELLHLRDSFLGVCLIKCKYTGLYFLVFYAAFRNVSWTYAEAAQIDGAGPWRIFLTIMLPMLSNTLIAVFVLQFITHFNDYNTPMVFLPNYPTMAYGLYRLKSGGQTMSDIGVILSATMLTCIPMVAIFIAFRDKIMGNINVGGIKG